MDQKLLDKFLNHQASKKEIEALKKDPETADLMALSTQAAGLKYEGFLAEENWRCIEHHIEAHRNQYQQTKDKSLFGRLIKLIPTPAVRYRLAAILVIVLGSYFFLSSENMALITPEGVHRQWTLPDGSEISLNAGSKASYSPESWNINRMIDLDGEAYFDVIKGSTFSVNTPSGIITVLGTEFNVKVRDGQFYVHCFEGLVKVQTPDTTVMLPQGSGMHLEHGILTKDQAIIGAKPDWMSGEISFENAPLVTVFNELQRQYAVDLIYSADLGIQIESAKFSGSFTYDDITTALKSICQPFGLSFDLEDKEVLIFRD